MINLHFIDFLKCKTKNASW